MATKDWHDATLTILNGAATSEEVNLIMFDRRRSKILTFIMPTTLPEVVTVHVAENVGGTYKPLNDGFGNDIVLLAGKAQTQSGLVAGALKLVSTGNVAGDRVFIIQGEPEA